jgi:8-amino-7-oxononanoate synthase
MQRLQEDSLLRTLRPTELLSATHLRRNGKTYLHFASNDYLALAWQQQNDSPHQTLNSKLPHGATASPLVVGASLQYEKLCQTIAHWQNTPAAIVFPSGYSTNLGTLRALISPSDLVLSDELNHACIIDACKLSRAKTLVYPHVNTQALEELLQTHRQRYRMAWILTDSLFSMHGNPAPIPEIERIAKQYSALAFADEAHASGVFGHQGRGLLDLFQADPDVWIKTGTLSKAIGSIGGFVAGSKLLCQLITQRARPLIFSTALPPSILFQAQTAITRLASMDQQRSHLYQRSQQLRALLHRLGLHSSNSHPLLHSPIIPIVVRTPQAALALSKHLESHNIYIPAIRPPTVPKNQSLLRVSLNAHHQEEHLLQLEQALQVFPTPLDT